MTDFDSNGNPYPLGAMPMADGIRFSFISGETDCGILLYDARTGRQLRRIPFSEEERRGYVYCRKVEGIRPQDVLYQFYRGEETVPDEHGRVFPGKRPFGERRGRSGKPAGFLPTVYDWEGDQCPEIPYSEALCYCIHVRGFTKHSSSKVQNRGTFAGVAEKIPYLREIGVTTLELQPAYEFEEVQEEADEKLPSYCVPGHEAANAVSEPLRQPPAPAGAREKKLNYWGYKKGYYYAPKAAYAASGNAPEEFRGLVRALHANHMELVMQFYFPGGMDRSEIIDILRFWTLAYHVDGFHLMGEKLPVEMAAADPLLADKKILYYGFEREKFCGRAGGTAFPHLAEYNDDYLYHMRKFLKGDENMLGGALRHMRYLPADAGRIHYMTNYCGFTLSDLVAYDYKHNEANGEENRDGDSCNCSWNCGEEGASRSRKVRQLRLRQMKNAICMLLFTQSTPLIFMGDEFGNTQGGNNNPWCQDNTVTWLDWGLPEKNSEVLEFWKLAAAFRKSHPVLRQERELRLMDYLSCGYPDLSYHGENAWQPDLEGNRRHAGMMLCGKYARTKEGNEDDFVYIAINMHWENHRLGLPKLPRGMCWRMAFSTAKEQERREPAAEETPESSVEVAARSIAVLVSVRVEPGGRRRHMIP